MKRILTLHLLVMMACTGFSQSLYITRNGRISFNSQTPMETIEGINNEVTSMMDTGKGDIVFAVLVKSFHFEKALMEEHFNENYMESTKFPKATFQGKIVNVSGVNFSVDGNYPVTVEGNLTIRGIQQKQTATGVVTVSRGKISAVSKFSIKLADYKVEIPALVAEKIAETVEITVNCQYEPKS